MDIRLIKENGELVISRKLIEEISFDNMTNN